MRRWVAALVVVLLALVIAAPPIRGDERFLRGDFHGRAFRLHLPDHVTAGRPLVVALHGCSQTPEDFALGTRMTRAASRRGVAVLYPAQSAFANAARCWNWFEFSKGGAAGGEVQQILDMARDVARTHGLDATRLVVIGFSAGGYLAVNLLCASSSVVGVGVMAGGPYRCAESAFAAVTCMRGERLDPEAAASKCAAGGAKPAAFRASLWHGDGDSVVSPANLTALAAMLARLQGSVAGAPDAVQGATRTVYRVSGRPTMETWLVRDMGHAWSGGDPRGTHTFPAGPDATEAMFRFLIDS